MKTTQLLHYSHFVWLAHPQGLSRTVYIYYKYDISVYFSCYTQLQDKMREKMRERDELTAVQVSNISTTRDLCNILSHDKR